MSFTDVSSNETDREPTFEMHGGFGEYPGLRMEEKATEGKKARSVIFVREWRVTNFVAVATQLMCTDVGKLPDKRSSATGNSSAKRDDP